jgi:glutathione S-transferase
MSLLIFEEVGENNLIISPSCYTIRLALNHMGLTAEFFGVKPSQLKDFNFKFLPVLKDDKRIIQSGFEVAKYLERNYPLSPTIFGGEAGTYLAKFVDSYVEDGLYTHLLCFLTEDIVKNLSKEDQKIFLSRVVLGNKSKKENLFEFNKKLNPIRLTLKKQEFLFGERPGYVDFLIYGLFSWGETLNGLTLLNRRDALNIWKNKMGKLNKKAA